MIHVPKSYFRWRFNRFLEDLREGAHMIAVARDNITDNPHKDDFNIDGYLNIGNITAITLISNGYVEYLHCCEKCGDEAEECLCSLVL
jgi:hypothetical protein